MFVHRLESMFTIGESQVTEQQAQQLAGNPRRRIFSTETPLENAEIHRKQRRRRQQETAKQRENRLTQRRQRRQHSDHKHVQKQRKNTTITLQMKPMKRGNTDCRRFKSDEEIRQRLKLTLQSEKLSSSMQR